MQHLSEEQKSRWLLGQARDDENEHARNCSACAAELRACTDAVSTFRDVMKGWSEREGSWKLEDAPDFSSWQPRARHRELSWVLTAAAAGLLLIPAYRHFDLTQRAPAAQVAQRDADVMLMEVVSTHLSRPLSAPMERVLALLPGQSLEVQINEREDVR